ncbi:MAG: hypothetical protein M3Q46_00815 [Verrucomicrobiota bacterium]|nr:hypothetical protein [Verrucomicrobiota bacterium]
MKPVKAGQTVFFEPWSLGDVMIAAAAWRERSEGAAIACHSMWHPLLRSALIETQSVNLIAVDLPYTTRRRGNPFDTGHDAPIECNDEVGQVLSIRGDLRDLAAARKIFPRAQTRMNGWVRFLGRKSSVVNLPFSLGWMPVQNRYRSWADLAGVPYQSIEATYQRLQSEAPQNGQVAIHVGAQWRSKQYPDVVPLRDALRDVGRTVKILAGPSDPLPAGLDEKDVTRAKDAQLIEEFRSAGQVITNDSGPMHVAAFLGCPTLVLVRTSPIEEWAPPGVTIVRSPETPRGYRPDRQYMSDGVLTGWPAVVETLSFCQNPK